MRMLMAVTLILGMLSGAQAVPPPLADAPPARAETPLKATKEYKGRISNELAMLAKDGYVAGPKAWAKLWKEWKIEGKLPAIDWKNEMVLVATAGGSGMGLSAALTDKGDLKAQVIATADIRPDSAFQIIVVPSKGVKTINGKKPAFESRPEEP